mmetsp:Transcript_20790/g.51880  ORF Transcript_20790/g.51880 Transcript_20790/m.51880 type:complete len:294 (+) Transcript_20790:97-978(+)
MERELVVLVPGGRAQARSLRHALEEFEVLDLHHRLHVEQRLLLERLVDPRAARTLGARKGEPVAAHNAPALLKVLPGVKLVLLQGESFAVEQSEPDAALDGVLVRLHPERDELVLVEPGGELLQALRLRRQSCRGRALHVRDLHRAEHGRHLAEGEVEAAARGARAEDVEMRERPIAHRLLVVHAQATAHVHLARTNERHRVGDGRSGEERRVVVAVEDTVRLPITAAVDLGLGRRLLGLREVEQGAARAWLDEQALGARLHERVFGRVARAVAHALAVHRDQLDGSADDVPV